MAVAATDAGVLLERDAELERLNEAFDAAVAGHGRLMLVAGEAGVGKTALVRRFCDELAARTAVLSGACDALATPTPLGPFVEIAESAGIARTLDSASAPHRVASDLLDLAGSCGRGHRDRASVRRHRVPSRAPARRGREIAVSRAAPRAASLDAPCARRPLSGSWRPRAPCSSCGGGR